MYSNGLKTIAVFAAEMQSQSRIQRLLCKYISSYAYKMGYNVAIFNWNNPFSNHTSYIDGQMEIFDLPKYEDIDAVIYLKNSIDMPACEKKLETKIRETVKGPCVSMCSEVEGFYSLVADDAAGIANVVRHFHEVHGCTKIAFMTGRIEMLDAQLRLNAYKETMEELGLEYDESYIFYGDYWKSKGPAAVSHFEASHYGMPEAIVCANDYMAVSVIKELIKRGYKVSEDIYVSGYDNVSDSLEVVPKLTTLSVPFEKLAVEAVNLIDRVIKGESVDNIPKHDPELICRESCGCHKLELWNYIGEMANIGDVKTDNAYMLRDMRFLTVSLENVKYFEEIADVVDSYMRVIGNYKSFFMCLNTDPKKDMMKPYPSFSGYTDEMMCYLAIVDRVRDRSCPTTFDRRELIPAVYAEGEPQIYYFTPLHFLNKNYGYTAISYSDYFGLQGDYYSFSANIGNALDAINDKIILRRTLEELESLYVSDTLTSLYNRRGFEIHANAIYEDCIERDKPVMVMGIDIDGLKYINDTYGHQAGDNAIQTFANALIYASTGKEICARVGGDEFDIIAGDYTREELNDFIFRIFSYLEKINDEGENEYKVKASYGALIIDTHEGNSLEYYINQCDKMMYEDKKRKKVNRSR